jgi:hypothetical protein
MSLTDFSVLDDCPFKSLDVNANGSKSGEENNGLQSDLFSLVVFGFRSPVQESNDVLGHL